MYEAQARQKRQKGGREVSYVAKPGMATMDPTIPPIQLNISLCEHYLPESPFSKIRGKRG